jgi:lipopolysaccharide transport system permease protein
MKQPELIIEAGRAERHYWADLWRYRELFYFLSWRDILVRYKQTMLGVAWAVLQPLLTILIMTVVFNRIAGLKAPDGVPYTIFVCAAQLPWFFFATAMGNSANSLVTNSSMISKVYFPRLIVPISGVIVSAADFCISLVILAGFMLWFQFLPGWQVVVLPGLMLLAALAAIGLGLFLSALTVKYRDFRFVIPFLVQFGLYASPVGYSSSLVEQKAGYVGRLIYSLNPMVGVIDGFRWAITRGAEPLFWPGLGMSLLSATTFIILGVWYFRKTEKQFADVI